MKRIETELALLSTIGVAPSSPEADKSEWDEFCVMFNYVTDPLHPLSPSSVQGASAPLQSPPKTDPALKAFQAVFRMHFRRSPYIDFNAAAQEAWIDFKIANDAKLCPSSSKPLCLGERDSELEMENARLHSTLKLEENWLRTLNDWKRDRFQKSAIQDLVGKFRLHLWNKFPSSPVKFYERKDIRQAAEVMTKSTVSWFLAEIPGFEDQTLVSEWSTELRHQLSRVVADKLAENKGKEESWELKISQAAAQYKSELVRNFFDKVEFARKEKVEGAHEKAKRKIEKDYALAGFLTDPILRRSWEARIIKEFQLFEGKWRAEGEEKLEAFTNEVKSEGQRLFKARFDHELGPSQLETMFNLVPCVAKRRLQRAAEEIGLVGSLKGSTAEDKCGGGVQAGDKPSKHEIKRIKLEPVESETGK